MRSLWGWLRMKAHKWMVWLTFANGHDITIVYKGKSDQYQVDLKIQCDAKCCVETDQFARELANIHSRRKKMPVIPMTTSTNFRWARHWSCSCGKVFLDEIGGSDAPRS